MEKKTANKTYIDAITGATSGLGRLVVSRLLDSGDEVRSIIKTMPVDELTWAHIPAGTIPYISDLTQNESDNFGTMVSALKDVDRVFHIAGASYNSANTPEELKKKNVISTENLLNALVEANRGGNTVRFIYASSVTVYNYKRTGEVLTEQSEPKPSSPYSQSKYIAERIIESFSKAHPEIEYTILRFGTLYGAEYAKPSFCKIFDMVKRGNMRYIGSGDNHLTFVHAEDAADVMCSAAANPKAANQVFNITEGKPYTQKYLIDLVAKYMGVSLSEKHINPLIAKLGAKTKGVNKDEMDFLLSDRIVSTDKAKLLLGFSPKRTMEKDGVKMIDVCKSTS